MCGICGSVGYADGEDLVQKMTRAMLHRGPDSEGCLNSGFINLGMRRLKIIDLKTGDQPVFNEDSSVAVVMNGEIYNFRELRQELLALGHQFTTQSDTEVVVHAYEAWGMDFLARICGMFALALLDRRQVERPRLVLARDRLGIKPLYLYKACEPPVVCVGSTGSALQRRSPAETEPGRDLFLPGIWVCSRAANRNPGGGFTLTWRLAAGSPGGGAGERKPGG